MTELKVINKKGNGVVRAFILDDAEIKSQKRHTENDGITKEEFLTILDKASRPVKGEAQSDSKKSET